MTEEQRIAIEAVRDKIRGMTQEEILNVVNTPSYKSGWVAQALSELKDFYEFHGWKRIMEDKQ